MKPSQPITETGPSLGLAVWVTMTEESPAGLVLNLIESAPLPGKPTLKEVFIMPAFMWALQPLMRALLWRRMGKAMGSAGT